MAYSSTNTYATVADVEARLTAYSVTWAADRVTVDGSRSSGELGMVEAGIEWSNGIIDAAILKLVNSVSARPANDWLRDRCVDLAAYRVMTIGGGDATPVLLDDYERALAWLERVEAGSLDVPGLDVGVILKGGRRMSGPIYGSMQWRPKR